MKELFLKSTKNIRDFGGTVTQDGRKLREGLFFRSASLNKLSKDDATLLFETCRIRTVIDLRTPKEIEEKPDRIPTGVRYLSIPVINDRMLGVTFEKNHEKEYQIPDLQNLYAAIVTDQAAIGHMKNIFAEICTDHGDSAVLWHCTQGKDRCGIISALFLTLLDVDREAIYRDYLMTNRYSRKRAIRYYRLILTFKWNKPLARKLYKIFIAHRCYLHAAFDAIDRQYGSMEHFLTHELQITPEMRRTLKERCLSES